MSDNNPICYVYILSDPRDDWNLKNRGWIQNYGSCMESEQ